MRSDGVCQVFIQPSAFCLSIASLRSWLCVACNYRLSPKVAFPAHIIDLKRSIAWIREHAFDIFHSVRTEHVLNAVSDFLEWCHARRDHTC